MVRLADGAPLNRFRDDAATPRPVSYLRKRGPRSRRAARGASGGQGHRSDDDAGEAEPARGAEQRVLDIAIMAQAAQGLLEDRGHAVSVEGVRDGAVTAIDSGAPA